MNSPFDTGDGCVGSKTKMRDEEPMSMGPPAQVLDCSGMEESGSQTATQPLTDSQESLAEEQTSMSQDEKPWGILYPYRHNLRPIELYIDEVSVGRSTGNIHRITSQEAGNIFFAISKIHFVIRKTTDGIQIEDKSSNGTSVNGILVGKNQRRVVDHNSFISIAKTKAYVFMFTRNGYMQEHPIELRRKYVVSRELGSGACGTVRLGFPVKGRSPVAIKIINKKKIGVANDTTALNEVKILRAVNHPTIIRMEDVVETDKHLYIILELAQGGELFDKIIQKTKFNEDEAKLHFYQMVSGIKYLHSMKIAHRDLKPENILLCSEDDSNPVVKITDMGLSKLVGETVCKTFCGTPQYLAPEVLINRVRGNGTYDFKVDMWSLGVILYILLSGCPPFNPDRSDKPLVRQISEGDYTFPSAKWNGISELAIDLVKKLMKVRSKERLSAEEALEHPWLSDKKIREKVEKLWQSQRPLNQTEQTDGLRKRPANEENMTVQPTACKRFRVDLTSNEDTRIDASSYEPQLV